MVGQMVPAAEIPIWETHFAREPWGYGAMDQLLSKTALQINRDSKSHYSDYMFTDAFDALTLTSDQFDRLSDVEKRDYKHRQFIRNYQNLELNGEEFEKLSQPEKNEYLNRKADLIKRVLN
jgi:hypothetical protein